MDPGVVCQRIVIYSRHGVRSHHHPNGSDARNFPLPSARGVTCVARMVASRAVRDPHRTLWEGVLTTVAMTARCLRAESTRWASPPEALRQRTRVSAPPTAPDRSGRRAGDPAIRWVDTRACVPVPWPRWQGGWPISLPDRTMTSSPPPSPALTSSSMAVGAGSVGTGRSQCASVANASG